MNLNLKNIKELSTEEKNKKSQEKTESSGEELNALRSGARSLIFDNQYARESRASQDLVRWLTTGEAAQYLRVSTSSLKTMIYRGQVRVHKLGRRNRFLKEELERLIVIPVSR